MHNIQAVLFDFDDTLQDREAAYRAYCAAFLGNSSLLSHRRRRPGASMRWKRILKAATASVRNTFRR